MKRSWIGFGMLVVLLAACILVTVAMTRIHEPIAGNLMAAADFAMKENWDQAVHFFQKAEEKWTKWEHFRTCFADHNPVEEIDGAFAMLKVYCAAREEVSFAGGCCDLARKVGAVGDAHKLVFWNLF